MSLTALQLRRTKIWNSQPHCKLGAPQSEKEAYKIRAEAWLTAMHEIDVEIAAARKEQ